MNAEDPAVNSGDASVASNDNRLTPLPGEQGIPNVAQRPTIPISRKGLAAIALLVISLAAVSAMSLQRLVASGKKGDDGVSKRAGDRPAAASLDPKKLDMSAAPAAGAASTANSAVRVPALVPTADELADPIGVRRSGQDTSPTASKRTPPEDAPAVLLMSTGSSRRTIDQPPVSESPSGDPLGQTRRNLGAYERQLQGLVDTLSSSTTAAKSGTQPRANIPTNSPGLAPSGGSSEARTHQGGDLFGGQLQGSATPTVSASLLANRSLVLPKGTAFTCALKTEVVSAASGFVSCQVQRNVYSDDGRVLLIERGSHMDGEYRITSVRPGTVRIPVLWVCWRRPKIDPPMRVVPIQI